VPKRTNQRRTGNGGKSSVEPGKRPDANGHGASDTVDFAESDALESSLHVLAFGVITIEIDGTIRNLNIMATRLLRCAPEEAIGKNFSAFLAPGQESRFQRIVRQAQPWTDPARHSTSADRGPIRAWR